MTPFGDLNVPDVSYIGGDVNGLKELCANRRKNGEIIEREPFFDRFHQVVLDSKRLYVTIKLIKEQNSGFSINARIVLCLARVKRVFHVFFCTKASLLTTPRFFMSSEEPYPPAAPRRPADLLGRHSTPARIFPDTATVHRTLPSKAVTVSGIRAPFTREPSEGAGVRVQGDPLLDKRRGAERHACIGEGRCGEPIPSCRGALPRRPSCALWRWG